MKIRYRLLTPSAVSPLKMTEHSAGFDLSADLSEALVLPPGDRFAVPTGVAIEIPHGHEAQIRPRSGLAIKLGLGVLNSPGTIDSDYRGEIKVILFNAGAQDIVVQPGMRIAQMVICPVSICTLEETEQLNESERAEGGFGHTGH
ncbi:MAG: dUTP diphosphatase [Candidatus Cloacimonadaceae bacterium]|nr:dUTP diphosphatase [Candidatus Cloacimonadaceae bacterium]MDP3114977.1 dUTP diphosphatase [Candidatus Cloacimonadaceae bacterium]